MSLAAINSCSSNCYNVFIEPFKQGAYNLHDAVQGEKIARIAQYALITEAESNRPITSLAERVSRAVIGTLLIIPIINCIVMAILRSIGSKFLYGFPISFVEPNQQQTAPLSPEQMIARKTEALARLTQIEQMIPEGGDPMTALTSHFRCNPKILQFDLDGLLEQYQTDEQPSKLVNLLDWATGFVPEEADEENPEEDWGGELIGGTGDNTRRNLQGAINRYAAADGQQAPIRNIFQNLVAYFDQKRAHLDELPEDDREEAEEALKTQCREVCDKIIDANRNCPDQMLSQLQTLAVEVLAENAASQGDHCRSRIHSLASFVLCKYRTNLLKEILTRQNENEYHMADLERAVFQNVAQRLGLRGAIFEAGAVYNFFDDLDERTEAVLEAFRQEYKPTEYLLEQLRTNLGDIRLLRNSIPEWANEHYDLASEDPQGNDRLPHEMDRRLSHVNFEELTEDERENPAIMSAGQGGDFKPASTAFLLEALGLIGQV